MDYEGCSEDYSGNLVDSKTNLIINYLPQTLTDEEFRSMFLSIGPVKMAKIVRDKKTGYSYGFGFVDYDNENDAERAITTLNGLQMQHKRIKVAFSRKGDSGETVKGANLYIRSIPLYWGENELNNYFSPYGDIVQSRVLVDLNTGISKRVGFVLYSKRSEAETAIEYLNGKAPPDSPDNLLIKFADDSSKKVKAPSMPPPPPPFQGMGFKPRFNSPGPMRSQRNRPHFNPMGSQNGNGSSYGGSQHSQYHGQDQDDENDGHVLFVYNIGTEADDRVLWELFGPCGTVSKVTVMMDQAKGICKGYGFVTMPNYQEAEYAIRARNGMWYNGKQLQVSFKK
ncbi:ELAV-like protein 1-B [Haliotis cracherodii]|uniref:ELAV-like protein 1-B n=1 Tax=Haliotis cracherodii TaxID=6455 RepID=UPI0039E883ED